MSVFLVLQNPWLLGGCFLGVLLLAAGVVGSLDSLLGFVVLLVYVGGALILFAYCFMLTPLQASTHPLPVSLFPVCLLLCLASPPLGPPLHDFYWVLSLLLTLGLLLFVVMACVVDIIDLSRGTLRVL